MEFDPETHVCISDQLFEIRCSSRDPSGRVGQSNPTTTRAATGFEDRGHSREAYGAMRHSPLQKASLCDRHRMESCALPLCQHNSCCSSTSMNRLPWFDDEDKDLFEHKDSERNTSPPRRERSRKDKTFTVVGLKIDGVEYMWSDRSHQYGLDRKIPALQRKNAVIVLRGGLRDHPIELRYMQPGYWIGTNCLMRMVISEASAREMTVKGKRKTLDVSRTGSTSYRYSSDITRGLAKAILGVHYFGRL